MTCSISDDGVIFCDGRDPGIVEYLACPFCHMENGPLQRCLSWWIFGGYEGKDSICGSCGFSWGSEWGDTKDVKAGSKEWRQMEANIAKVASVPEPKCLECQDTGDRRAVGPSCFAEDDPQPCSCGLKLEQAREVAAAERGDM